MRHLRNPFFLLAFLLSTTLGAAFAQTQSAAMDVVYLKSGQSYQGIIIEQKPGESIRLLRSAESDTLLFTMDSIDRITKAIPAANASAVATTTPPTEMPAQPRQFNTNSLSVALQVSTGGGDYSVLGFGAIVQKYFPDERAWSGVGLHYLGDQNNYGVNTMPIVLHNSYEIVSGAKGRLGTLGFLDLGCAINLSDNYFDELAQTTVKYGNGWYFNTGLRFRVNVLKNSGIWLDLGYLFQNSKLRDAETNKKLRTKSWNVFQIKGAVFF